MDDPIKSQRIIKKRTVQLVPIWENRQNLVECYIYTMLVVIDLGLPHEEINVVICTRLFVDVKCFKVFSILTVLLWDNFWLHLL